MLTLPPVPPAVGWRHQVRLPRDHYVRVDGNDYSVDPAAVGRQVRGRRRPGHGDRHPAPGRCVAEHDRCWARHQIDHRPGPPRRRPRAGRAGPQAHAERREPDVVEQRDLGVYDTAFGITDEEVA